MLIKINLKKENVKYSSAVDKKRENHSMILNVTLLNLDQCFNIKLSLFLD